MYITVHVVIVDYIHFHELKGTHTRTIYPSFNSIWAWSQELKKR